MGVWILITIFAHYIIKRNQSEYAAALMSTECYRRRYSVSSVAWLSKKDR